ncbi:MAG: sigma 54-interacting transcriptional regulator [Clostridia bacterium]|nr:sigma 54-interacting transcriptional regulator [Clostridia bacterium]
METSGEEEAWELKQALDGLTWGGWEGVCIAGADGLPIYVNQAFARIIGLPMEKLLHTRLQELSGQGILPLELLERALGRGDRVARLVTVAGREWLLTLVPVANRQGRITKLICLLREPPPARNGHPLPQEVAEPSLRLARFLAGKEELPNFHGIVANSPAMSEVINLALKAAQVDSNVLITGETGVGKDVVARLIHQKSRRAGGKFVKVDCASIPEQLMEAELFGYERGAFTDARREGKAGRLELAHNGTLFLDEIAEMPLHLQAKLLNVLQDRKFTRIGGLEQRAVDFRLLAATNRDLEQLVEAGQFRRDLFYRLNVIRIHIPPLRAPERREDILLLLAHFLRFYGQQYGIQKQLSADALECLLTYYWPGNVRELANVVEQVVVISPREVVTPDDLPAKILEPASGSPTTGTPGPTTTRQRTLKEAVEDLERELITQALQHSRTLREAADSLGVDISTLLRKKKKLGIGKSKRKT